MKKKLSIVLAALMATSLVACSKEKAEEQKDKFSKNLEKEIEDIADDVSEYIDDEIDIGNLTKSQAADGSSDVTEAPSSEDRRAQSARYGMEGFLPRRLVFDQQALRL